MYRNLEAELKRKGISRKQLAEMMNLTTPTICNKINGKQPLLYSEVEFIVVKVFHNEYEIKYLFAKSDQAVYQHENN